MSQIWALQKGRGSGTRGETKGERDQPGQPCKSPAARGQKQEMSCRAEAGAWEAKVTVQGWRTASQRHMHKPERTFHSEHGSNPQGGCPGRSAQASVVVKSRAGAQHASMINREQGELRENEAM